MGFDIDMTVEARRDGRWDVVLEPPMAPQARDYTTWSRLGLEHVAESDDPAPITSSRGLPADATAKTRAAWQEMANDGMAAGTSWLTLAELLPHREHLGGGVGEVVDQMTAYGAPVDVRLVFWFIN